MGSIDSGNKTELQIAKEIKARGMEANRKWNPRGLHNEGELHKGVINGEAYTMTSADWAEWWLKARNVKRDKGFVSSRRIRGWSEVAATMGTFQSSKAKAESLARSLMGEVEKAYSKEKISNVVNSWLSGSIC